jgi:hypothetical protein
MTCHADRRNRQVIICAVEASAVMLLGQDAESMTSGRGLLDNTGFHLRATLWLLMHCAQGQSTIDESLMTRTVSIRIKAGSDHRYDE